MLVVYKLCMSKQYNLDVLICRSLPQESPMGRSGYHRLRVKSKVINCPEKELGIRRGLYITETAEEIQNIQHRELKNDGKYADYLQVFKELLYLCGNRCFCLFVGGEAASREYKQKDLAWFIRKNFILIRTVQQQIGGFVLSKIIVFQGHCRQDSIIWREVRLDIF